MKTWSSYKKKFFCVPYQKERNEQLNYFQSHFNFGNRHFLLQNRNICTWLTMLITKYSALQCLWQLNTLLNPFWSHWLSLQSDWLSAVRFIHKSHIFFALNRIFFTPNENKTAKQNNQSQTHFWFRFLTNRLLAQYIMVLTKIL